MTSEPSRRGLPVDPVLQLWAGELRALGSFGMAGATPVIIAPANPSRVALFVGGAGLPGTNWSCGPNGAVPLTGAAPRNNVGWVQFHCRDWPGFVQAGWTALGDAGAVLLVLEYTLLPRW